MLFIILLLLFYQTIPMHLIAEPRSCPLLNGPQTNQTMKEVTNRQCKFKPIKTCPMSRYRTLDGTCNNAIKPAWGAVSTPYTRFVSSKYADGKSMFPKSVTGEPLPPPRNLSRIFFRKQDRFDTLYNLNALMWGQVLAHDMSSAAGVSQTKNETLVCCKNGNVTKEGNTNSQCAPIKVFSDDPYQGPFGIRCFDFERTETTRLRGCTPAKVPVEQLNAVTSFLDASIVYGVNKNQADSIREMKGGRLTTIIRGGKIWPPQDPNPSAACTIQFKTEPCYLAGDLRVNQNTHLTMLQVIFLREHNRIAKALGSINPNWDDETLYQETRRILIAILQHIHYYEYLPTILDFNTLVKKKIIYPGAVGYVSDYNATVNPSIINEFTTAAFRHPHNEIRGMLKIIEQNRETNGQIRLSDWFNRPLILEIDNFFSGLLRGFTVEQSGFSDQFWDPEVTQFLFRGEEVFGQDLGAIDIQRGRDHGLGSYREVRRASGLPVPNTFLDMLDYISPENVQLLKSVYKCVDDVDLRVGGGLERSSIGSKAGPTFTRIILEQFYRTRVGDKYFYENGQDPNIRFSIEQLKSIRAGASSARLFCDNGDNIDRIQRLAFLQESIINPLVSCKSLPSVNLSLWKVK